MKSTKLLFLSLSALACVSAGPIMLSPSISTNGICGPYTGTENSAIEIQLTGVTESMSLRADYYYISSGSKITSETVSLAGKVENGNANLNYTLRLKNRLTSIGLQIVFTLTGGKTDLSRNVYLYPKVSDTINAFDYVYEPYVIEKTAFEIINNRAGAINEKIQFENTLNYLSIADQFKIDISEISFSYSPIKAIKEFGEYYLKIYDPKAHLSNLSRDDNGYVLVPLKLMTKGNDVYLDFASGLYYNPNNLDPSSTLLNGYVETNQLFLSPKFLKTLSNDDVLITLRNVGLNDVTINIPLLIDDPVSNIGLCHNSKYCYRGGIKE